MVTYPKISVFFPTYNHSFFIKDAIDSILIQDYPNIEIVIGDDYSEDNTREIILKYAEKYPEKFKLIFNEENLGVTRNCNKILKQCSGEYIAFFSGDDLWLPGKLEAQINWFNKNLSAVLCYTATEVIDTNGNHIKMANKPNELLIKENIIRAIYDMAENSVSYMVKSSAIPVRGFPNEVSIFSDFYFHLAVGFNGMIGGLEEVYAKYRRHPKNTSTSNVLFEITDHLTCLLLLKRDFPLKSQLLEKEINDRVIKLAQVNEVDLFATIGSKELLIKGWRRVVKKIKSYFPDIKQ